MTLFSKTKLWDIDINSTNLILFPSTDMPIGVKEKKLVMEIQDYKDSKRDLGDIEKICYNILREKGYYVNGFEEYGFIEILPPMGNISGIGIFQIKKSNKEAFNLRTIAASFYFLNKYLNKNKNINVRMYFPGIGSNSKIYKGSAHYKKILKIIQDCPDNLIICESEEN